MSLVPQGYSLLSGEMLTNPAQNETYNEIPGNLDMIIAPIDTNASNLLTCY